MTPFIDDPGRLLDDAALGHSAFHIPAQKLADTHQAAWHILEGLTVGIGGSALAIAVLPTIAAGGTVSAIALGISYASAGGWGQRESLKQLSGWSNYRTALLAKKRS